MDFHMDFALRLCESVLWGCRLVSYVDFLFNKTEGMFCGCRLVLDVDLFGMWNSLFNLSRGL